MIKFTTKLLEKQRIRKDKIPVRKLTTNTIKIDRVRDDFLTLLNDRLTEISAGTAEDKWNIFKSIVYKVLKEKLDTAIRKHKDWFDGNSMELEELINNRNLARNNLLIMSFMSAKARYKNMQSTSPTEI